MAIPFNTLLDESKCYLCLGISQAEALELALLNRIAEGGSGSEPLVYRALMTQVGLVAPTVVVLENTIGNIVWSYDAPGEYIGTLAGAFTANKTFSIISKVEAAAYYGPTVNRQDANTLFIRTDGDDRLFGNSLEILVYP